MPGNRFSYPQASPTLALFAALPGTAAAQSTPSNVVIYQAINAWQASVNSLQTSVKRLQSTINGSIAESEGKVDQYAKTIVVGMEDGAGARGTDVAWPAGKRLVVQPLSAQAGLDAGVQLVHVGMRSNADPEGVGSLGVIVPAGGNFTTVFASAGAQVNFLVGTSHAPCAATSLPTSNSVYGHLVIK